MGGCIFAKGIRKLIHDYRWSAEKGGKGSYTDKQIISIMQTKLPFLQALEASHKTINRIESTTSVVSWKECWIYKLPSSTPFQSKGTITDQLFCLIKYQICLVYPALTHPFLHVSYFDLRSPQFSTLKRPHEYNKRPVKTNNNFPYPLKIPH